jgi:two-component system response regulator CpxR
MLEDYLSRHSYNVVTAHNGEKGLQKLTAEDFSIVLLDVMLPGADGFEVLRRLRAFSSISVLLLTARGEDVDRIVGLELGADDYLPKPFNPRELLARIRAILRRSSGSSGSSQLPPESVSLLGLELNAAARTARCNGAELTLTDVEFTLLQTLMRSAGEVVDREQLTASVLGRKFHPFDRSLDMHISRLRHKLGNMGDKVKTIRGVGYQLAISNRKTGGE